MLDRTEQRILGVLIEKEATVPDTYPLTENALRAGCNQSNNRDPVMELQPFELVGAMMSLMEKGWISRIDGSGRATKYRHKVVERLGLRPDEMAIFAELLLRGPQAPGALKPRIARFGVEAEVAEIEAALHRMAARPQPLVAQLPLGPRERDRRFALLLAEGAGHIEGEKKALPGQAAGEVPRRAESVSPMAAPTAPLDLASRVERLERELGELRELVEMLRARNDA